MLEPFGSATPRIPAQGSKLVQTAEPIFGLILGPGKNIQPDGSPGHFISVIDMDAIGGPEYMLNQIQMPFFGHGIVPDPVNPELASVFQKKGAGACEVDLKNLEMTRIIETAANRRFYGHGAYSPDGSLLYCTETVLDEDFKGLIAVRDAKSHEELGEFPTFGSSPHDCWLIDAGKTMVVTNGGGPLDGDVPSVTYIDVASQKLLEKLEPQNERINAGHLAISSAGDLAVISAPREGLSHRHNTGGISLRAAGGEFKTLTEPGDLLSRLVGETLSLAIDEQRGIVATTTPISNALTFWDISTGKLVEYFPAHNPRGVALTQDGSHFVVSYEKPPHVSMIAADTLTKVADVDLQWTGMSGSHIVSYSLPAELRA